MTRTLSAVLGFAAVIASSACTGGNLDRPSPALTVAPTTVQVAPSDVVHFAAKLDGTPNQPVQWKVNETGGGTIDATGSYTAPATEGTYTVTASLGAIAFSAKIGVNRNVRVAVTPLTAAVVTGQTLALTAAVSGTSNKSVTWSVAEAPAGGTVTADGTYTAPTTTGVYHVVATSAADPTRSDTSTITVTAPSPAPVPAPVPPPVAVTVSPQTASVVAGNTIQLTGNVSGTTNTSITWSVAEAGGGTVDANGLYTAPLIVGTFHAVATSVADPSKSATATITVTPTPATPVSGPVISSFGASPASVAQGASSTLSWTTSGATSLSIDNGVGTVTGLSSKSVTPSATTTYTLTATNSAGSVTATAVVTVSAAPPSSTSDIGTCTQLISDGTHRSAPPLALPGYSASNPNSMSIIDPVFGTKITRVTGDVGSSIPNTGAIWRTDKPYAGPIYAKDPPWNADESILAIKAGVDGQTLFVDGNTYVPLYTRGNVKAEYRWHPTDPRYMIYVDVSGQAGYFEPATNTYTLKFNPGSGFGGCSLGSAEGNVSYDGRWVVVQCLASGVSGDAAYVFFAADLQTGTKYPTIRAIDLGFSGANTSDHTPLDWATISPLGNYIVASQDYQQQRVLTLNGAIVSQWGGMGHYDLGVDESGAEVAYNGGDPAYRRLSDASLFSLPWPGGSSAYHSSTRNNGEHGWGYASLESATTPLDGEIVAHELTGNGRIRRIAHHRATSASYDRAAFAAVSRDGKRVLYRSDWGNSSGPAYGFVVDIRNVCP